DFFYHVRRTDAYRPPMTPAEALSWSQKYGTAGPDSLVSYNTSPGGLMPDDTLQTITASAFLTVTTAGAAPLTIGQALRAGVADVATNVSLAVIAEKVTEKYGAGAGALAPWVATFGTLLTRKAVASPALQQSLKTIWREDFGALILDRESQALT